MSWCASPTGFARIVQEKARELAALESLDNGKPIRESRDVDIPQPAAERHPIGRAGDVLQRTMGCFLNTVVLRADLTGRSSATRA